MLLCSDWRFSLLLRLPLTKIDLNIFLELIFLMIFLFLYWFKHVVFFLATVLHALIPNVPSKVREQMEREKLLTQKALWSVHHRNKKNINE